MIRAVILDLDGTLIGRDEAVTPRVARAVSLVRERAPVVIASGREAANVVRYARRLGLSSPQISDGGAVILDPGSGRFLWTAPLPPDLGLELVRSLHSAGTVFIATLPEGAAHSPATVAGRQVIRVSALDLDEAGAGRLLAQLEAWPGLNAVKVFLPYNGLWAVDVTASGVDKAAAASILAGMMGIEVSQAAAAGDSFNDLTLLQSCGLSVAMGGAPQELKDAADYVAPTVEEDGLAVALEDFVLPRLRDGGQQPRDSGAAAAP